MPDSCTWPQNGRLTFKKATLPFLSRSRQPSIHPLGTYLSIKAYPGVVYDSVNVIKRKKIHYKNK